jgi:AsmA-like C-terminal region
VNKQYLWLLPIIPIGLLAVAILSLPSFVASSAHRNNIEDLASSLTGRQVRISGKLSLGLFPAPEITAAGVTINGPDNETITARSLALTISLPALLHGQLSATTLSLHAPTIAFPWPLPGGAAAIAPPTWLAALHAQIQNGDISFGAAHFRNVDADLYTGSNGTLTITGTGTLADHPLTLTLAFGAPQLTGTTPVTVDAASGDYSLHFTGGLNAASILSGRLEFAAPKIAGTASLTAGATALTATTLQFADGKASVTGSATLDFLHPALTAALTAANLDISALRAQSSNWPSLPATTLTLNATNLLFDGQSIPELQTSLDADANGITLHSLQASLPGNASLTANGQISPAGAITAQASLDAPDLPTLLTGTGVTPPATWTTADLAAAVTGTEGNLTFTNLIGTLGPNDLSGTVILTGRHAAGAVNFDQLDLPHLLAWFGQHPVQNFTADGQITATNASFGRLPLTHLLLDASLTDHLNIRRISANLFDGLASGSVTLDPSGQITAARGFLVLPSAKPLAALLPPAWQPPAALVQPSLHFALFAQGPSTALATSMIATLGDFTLTAAPVINLAQQSATGPLSLRAPNAIAALKIFGFSHAPATPPPCNLPPEPLLTSTGVDSACAPPSGQTLAWPGAGSLSLRADVTAAPTQFGLPDFVLSLGGLTANGRLLRTNGIISGQIDSGTLALPAVPADAALPWTALAAAQGKITLTAKHVLYNGAEILGSSLGSLTLAPNTATLAITHASLAGGNLSGSLTATTATTAAPALAATFTAVNMNAASLNLPINFPYTLPTGTLTAQANLTASGYSPRIWAATLAGSANLTATQGSLIGFSLTGIANALKSTERTHPLRTAMTTGTTNFQNFTFAATGDHGNASLTRASLTGLDGNATATGSIDIFDNTLALQLALQPNVTPPLSLGMSVLGNWSAPKQFLGLKPALSWPPSN